MLNVWSCRDGKELRLHFLGVHPFFTGVFGLDSLPGDRTPLADAVMSELPVQEVVISREVISVTPKEGVIMDDPVFYCIKKAVRMFVRQRRKN